MNVALEWLAIVVLFAIVAFVLFLIATVTNCLIKKYWEEKDEWP